MNYFEHQKNGINFFIDNGGKAVFAWDMGTGKTVAAIGAYEILRQRKPSLKLLVFCPLSLINAAWGADIEKFFPGLSWANVRTMKKIADVDIYIANYESLRSSAANKLLAEIISKNEFMIVLDESSRIKNHKAQVARNLLSMRKRFPYRLIMSATPAPNDETEWWPQVTFVDENVLHPNFYGFRNQYFHLARNGQKFHFNGQTMTKDVMREIMKKGFRYEIMPDKRIQFLNRLKQVVNYVKKRDCLDLPEQVDEVRLVTLGAEQGKTYRAMVKELVAEIDDIEVMATTALTKIMKLRQITSGFGIDSDGAVRDTAENPKMNELMDILDDAGEEQAIIWCQFHHEIDKVCLELDRAGKTFTTLYGETKDKDAAIEAFKAGSAKYLIAHPRSAAHGLTFVNCSLQIFYSLDYSLEYYEQAKGRTHRPGQKKTCVYIHILAEKTIDEIIYNVLRRKGKAVEIVEQFLKRG